MKPLPKSIDPGIVIPASQRYDQAVMHAVEKRKLDRGLAEGIVTNGYTVTVAARTLRVDRAKVSAMIGAAGLRGAYHDAQTVILRELRYGDSLRRQKCALRRVASSPCTLPDGTVIPGKVSRYLDVYWIPRLRRWAARPFLKSTAKRGYYRMVELGYYLSEWAAHRAVRKWKKANGMLSHEEWEQELKIEGREPKGRGPVGQAGAGRAGALDSGADWEYLESRKGC